MVRDILFSTKPNFDKWLDKMGTDFSVRFPKVYRFGVFRRALRFVENR